MLNHDIQSIKRKDMFIVDIGNERKKFPFTVLKTTDINDGLSLLPNNNDEITALFFDSICIRHIDDFPLIDIGYSPTEKLELKIIRKKNIYFLLPFLNYTYSCKLFPCHTVFDAETYFAKEFFTVPQNIYIEYQNRRLLDDEYLFEYENTQEFPFTISFKEGYQIYYTFFDQFHLVCIREESTLKNLKETLLSKFYINSGIIYAERIQNYFKTSDQITIEKSNQPLKDLEGKIKIFDFDFNTDVKGKVDVPIELIVSIFFQKEKVPTYYYIPNISPNSSIYLVTCFLEKEFLIDRSQFIPYDTSNKPLDINSIIPGTKLSFRVNSNLHVKTGNKTFECSYLSTIDDIKALFNFNQNKFGIIINKHFAGGRDKNRLIQYLNNSDESRNMTEIKLKRPINSCYIISFTNLESNRTKSYIVPKNIDFGQVSILYLKYNFNSLEFSNKVEDKYTHDLSFDYKYKDKTNFNIKFFDESDKAKEISITIIGENPRVIDLLYGVSLKKNYWKKKYSTFEAYFKGRKMYCNQYLSSIRYSNEEKVTVKGYFYQNNQNEDTKTIKILDLVNNKTIEIQYNDDYITTKEIISKALENNQIKGNNLCLFMEYIQLEPNDHPMICKQEHDFFILNQIDDMKILTITNRTSLKIELPVTIVSYSRISEVLSAMFSLTQSDEFKFHCLDMNNEYKLSMNFDAGSIPKDSDIVVDYSYTKSNLITFRFDGKNKKIEVSDIDLHIQELKQEIQSSINKYDTTFNSMFFSFYDFELDDNKKFTDYKIPQNSLISIYCRKESFIVTVKTPEMISSEYRVMPDDTIGDLTNLIKLRNNYSGRIALRTDSGRKMANSTKMTPEMVITLHCDQSTIQCDGLLGREELTVSNILSIKEATAYLKLKLENKNICIFIFNEATNNYEKVDPNKKLFEIETDLFVHQLFEFESLQFDDKEIRFNIKDNFIISECVTIGWFKENYIACRIFSNPNEFYLATRKTKLNENMSVYKVFRENHDQVFIKFKSDSSENLDSPKSRSKKSNSFNVSKCRPKKKPIDENQNKELNPSNSSDTLITSANSQRSKRTVQSDETEEEERAKSLRQKQSKEQAVKNGMNKKKIKDDDDDIDEEEKKSKSPKSNQRKEQDLKKGMNKKKINDDDDDDIDEEEEEKKSKSPESKQSKEQDLEKGMNKNKIDDGVIEEEEEESDDTMNDSDEEKESKSEDKKNDEEKIKKIIEEDEEPLIEYKIQIGREEVRTIKIKESATINDMKVQIAKEEGDIDPSCVSILFAGKNLKKTIVIKNLKLEEEDILQVYIRKIEEILLRSAKALRVYGQGDMEEYYSEYEEEDENY